MEQRKTEATSDRSRDSIQTEHDKSELVQKGNEIIEMGKEKIQDMKKDLPKNIEARADNAVVWMRENPYKTTSIGLLGLLSLKSKFARNIAKMLIVTAGTIFIKDKLIRDHQ